MPDQVDPFANLLQVARNKTGQNRHQHQRRQQSQQTRRADPPRRRSDSRRGSTPWTPAPENRRRSARGGSSRPIGMRVRSSCPARTRLMWLHRPQCQHVPQRLPRPHPAAPARVDDSNTRPSSRAMETSISDGAGHGVFQKPAQPRRHPWRQTKAARPLVFSSKRSSSNPLSAACGQLRQPQRSSWRSDSTNSSSSSEDNAPTSSATSTTVKHHLGLQRHHSGESTPASFNLL